MSINQNLTWTQILGTTLLGAKSSPGADTNRGKKQEKKSASLEVDTEKREKRNKNRPPSA